MRLHLQNASVVVLKQSSMLDQGQNVLLQQPGQLSSANATDSKQKDCADYFPLRQGFCQVFCAIQPTLEGSGWRKKSFSDHYQTSSASARSWLWPLQKAIPLPPPP
jgi:hypothetical protein